jgi:hypothetical protein
MRHEVTTTIMDDEGNSHEYQLIHHPADKAFNLLPQVMKVFAEPIGQAFEALSLKGSKDDDGSLSKLLQDNEDQPIGALMGASVDGVAMGRAITLLADRMMEAGGTMLCLELLAHTTRNGKKLKNRQIFNQSYQGNLGELFRALWWVINENFGGAVKFYMRPFVQKFLGPS